MGLRSCVTHTRFIASLLGFALVLSAAATSSCSSSSSSPSPTPSPAAPSTDSATIAVVDRFWLFADESVHEAQASLRSARQASRQMGGEVGKDYEQIIGVGHRLGGLGHDHVLPAQGAPVIQMLDGMISSVEGLIQAASTSAELEEASRATDASVTKLPIKTQRLYHLLKAKKTLTTVRERALAVGFRPAS